MILILVVVLLKVMNRVLFWLMDVIFYLGYLFVLNY